MQPQRLTLIKPEDTKGVSLSDKIAALQHEARNLAREHVMALQAALINVEQMASDIAEGGDAYPPGVRDIARRLAEDCEARVHTIEAITNRTR